MFNFPAAAIENRRRSSMTLEYYWYTSVPQNSSRWVSGSAEFRTISCFCPYTPCSTDTPASVHLVDLCMSSLQASTRLEKSWAPCHFSQPPWYCILLPDDSTPCRDSWGMNKTLPGRSRTDTECRAVFRKNFVDIRVLAVTKKQQGTGQGRNLKLDQIFIL